MSADTRDTHTATGNQCPVAGVPTGNIPVQYTNYHVCKMSFRAMHDYSLGTFRKHAKSRTGHNADIVNVHGTAECNA